MGAAFQSFTTLGALVVAISATPVLANGALPNEVAARDGAVRLEPLSPWNIDFGDNRCRLARFFGTEEERHLLMFEQAAPDSYFGISIAGRQVERLRVNRRFYIGMERDEEMRERTGFSRAQIAGFGDTIILTNFTIDQKNDGEDAENSMSGAGIDLEEAARIDRIVMHNGRRVLSFETGNMMPPFQALNACTSDLLRVWGLDAEKHVDYTRPRWTNENAIVRRIVRDYPRQAIRAGEQAIFRMRVIIEKDGSVSDCLMENSTKVDHFDEPACRAMMEARFEPARDAEGNPMRSYYATTVNYTLN